MNKSNIIEIIAGETLLPKHEVETIIDSFLEEIEFQLIDGTGKVKLSGFGTFFVKPCKSKRTYNFHKSEAMITEGHIVPKIKFSKRIIKALASK